MNPIEKQKRMDLLMKIGLLIFVVLALIATIAFFIATKDVGQAIFMNTSII